MWQSIVDKLSEKTGQATIYLSQKPVSGGCIHKAQILETNRGSYFVKTNDRHAVKMFKEEALALNAIRESNTLRCPAPILYGSTDTHSYLILEYVDFVPSSLHSMSGLGRNLANLHKIQSATFGWSSNNFIGSTPQNNEENHNWPDFFLENRLKYQIKLAESNGLRLNKKSELFECYDFFFKDYSPTPALLHGDLWGGNIGFTKEGTPFVFDPASYYGDRETDLAFSEMFGGFSPEFYSAYNEAYPLDSGFKYRKRLYNLYHELNHFNLFGESYGTRANETINYLINLA